MERVKSQEAEKTVVVENIECPAIEINNEDFPIIIPDEITDKKEQ